MLLAPRVDLTALVHVGDKYFVLERLVVEGGGVMLLQPFLNVGAVVRVAVGGDDGVVHQSALKRHVLQLLCSKKRESAARRRARDDERTGGIGKGGAGGVRGRHGCGVFGEMQAITEADGVMSCRVLLWLEQERRVRWRQGQEGKE